MSQFYDVLAKVHQRKEECRHSSKATVYICKPFFSRFMKLTIHNTLTPTPNHLIVHQNKHLIIQNYINIFWGVSIITNIHNLKWLFLLCYYSLWIRCSPAPGPQKNKYTSHFMSLYNLIWIYQRYSFCLRLYIFIMLIQHIL